MGKARGCSTSTVVIDYPVYTLLHALTECKARQFAATLYLRCAQVYAPTLSAAGRLLQEVDTPDPVSLPTVAIIATGIGLIWSNRLISVVTSLAGMQAELEALAGLFRQARGRRLREAGGQK